LAALGGGKARVKNARRLGSHFALTALTRRPLNDIASIRKRVAAQHSK